MVRRRLWRNHVVSLYWRTHHPLLRFLCLHEAVTLPFVVAIFWPKLISAIIHLHFGDCLSGTLFSSWWSAMEYRRCQPPCARFIAREDPHSKCIKCLGFSHARDAVYGTSKCKIAFGLGTCQSLEGLVTAPFEPLESASERILTLKVTLLLALTSLKRVGDCRPFFSETCMDFARV